MISLGGRDIVKEANQLLANQVLMEKREVLDGVEDGWIGENGSVK